MTPPRRRIVTTIRIEADDWSEVSYALNQLLTDIAVDGELPTVSVSGGCTSGWTISSSEDPAINHDRFVEALDNYIAARKGSAA